MNAFVAVVATGSISTMVVTAVAVVLAVKDNNSDRGPMGGWRWR